MMEMFKNSRGKWLTKALFFELTVPATRGNACFSLKEEDHCEGGKVYKSLKKLYMSHPDPTEYDFATQVLGGWEHWQDMQYQPDIMPYVEKWREERDVMLQSRGITKMIEINTSADNNYQAAKWLAEKGWQEVGKRGRPSKEEVKKAAREAASVRDTVFNDLERIRALKKES